MFRSLLSRPYLLIAILFGLASYFATGPFVARYITRALIGWDSAVVAFIGLAYFYVRHASEEEIRSRAIRYEEGGNFVLVAAVFASILSVAALVVELSEAKGHRGSGLRVLLSVATIVLSWFFMQVVFALHYAHEYYLELESGRPTGGIDFGAAGVPDYWDFVHFAIVVGATAQTADISYSSKKMRRIGTAHTLVAFGFNTAILATMVNVAGEFF